MENAILLNLWMGDYEHELVMDLGAGAHVLFRSFSLLKRKDI